MLLSLLNIKNIKTDGENLQIENWIRKLTVETVWT